MKLLLPTLATRKRVVTYLKDFFEDEDIRSYNRAIVTISRFYEVKIPKTSWHNSTDMKTNDGMCLCDGVLLLIYPESWKKRKTNNTCSKWVNVVLHEMGHFILWANSESKADQFALHMQKGTN